ncbi:MAG: hypothetical protein ACOYVF_07905 [Candidatus Zixiibacteriota bacterium]
MDFGKILNNSFKTAWEYKTLWILGLFASGSFTGFNLPTKDIDWDRYIDFESLGMGRNFMDALPPAEILLIPVIGFLLLFALVMLVLNLICIPAVIDGVNKIARGGVYTLSGSFKAGLHFFWRFLGLFLLSFFATGVSVVALILIGVVFFLIHVAIGIISLLFLLPLLFMLIFTVTNIYSLTQRAMVVRDISIGDALEEGFFLYRKNFLNNLIIFLIHLGLTIGLGLAAAIVWMVASLPIGAVVMAMGVGLVPAMIIGLILGLPVSFVVGGYLGTVFANIYTYFYFELVEPGGARQQPAPAPAG